MNSHPNRPAAVSLSRRLALKAALAAPLLVRTQVGLAQPQRQTVIAMHGDSIPLARLAYVNPAAPKGGRFTLGMPGTYDSLNPFAVRGAAGYGLRHYLYESLLVRHYDEPFTLYGHLAEAIEVAPDRSSIRFFLNPAARFSDGAPLTAKDVAFSFELLKTKGRPNLRIAYGKVASIAVIDAHTVHFDLKGADDHELPMIIGLMPVLPSHAVDADSFGDRLSAAPPGSGPYRLHEAKLGDSLTFRRKQDWWAKDLPLTQGLFNFDEIRVDYYRDSAAMFEAFRKGLIDFRLEVDPAQWANGYDFPARRDGRVQLKRIPLKTPKGLKVIAFNARRPPLDDVRVRQALALLFDGEWTNRNLYASGYARSFSIFEDSELSARARPADQAERALLAAAGSRLTDDALEKGLTAPVSDGSGADRATLRQALALFEAAGYRLRDTVLTGPRGPLTLDYLATTREQARLGLAYARFAARAGVTVNVRQVDSVQFNRRTTTYDFDLLPYTWFLNTLSPGNEQAFYWSSPAAAQQGSSNIAGVTDPAVDALVARLVAARSREDLRTAARALDRTLQGGYWWIPLFHVPEQWIALWNHIHMPAESSLFGYLTETWWREPPAAR